MTALCIGNYPGSIPECLNIGSVTELGDSSNGSVVLYDEVYYQVVADDFDPLSVASKVLPSLNPNGGKLNISTISNKEAVEKIQMAFMLAGLKVQSESVHGENRVFTAEYRRHNSKSVSIGRLKLEEKKTDTVQINMEENDDDIIDEDDLLDAGVIATPPAVDMDAIKDANDCGGRKACDNCTCGRAEQEATTAKEAQVPTSSCGNCAKGDAFRCAGCPFLGKPAFKPGEEHLVLDMTDDL